MPSIVEYVANYSANLHYGDLPADTVHLLKRMIIDSIGCAVGGYTAEPSKISRDLAGDVSSRRPCTIIGSGLSSSPELATFANGVMIRYLDFNDGYTALESGHPSDSIAATLAGAEMVGAGGRRPHHRHRRCLRGVLQVRRCLQSAVHRLRPRYQRGNCQLHRRSAGDGVVR